MTLTLFIITLYCLIAYFLQLFFEYLNVRTEGKTLSKTLDNQSMIVVAWCWGLVFPVAMLVGILICVSWPFVQIHRKIVATLTRSARRHWEQEHSDE